MFCPPIYVISLKRTPERRLQIQRQLDAFGLSYQFIEAVDKYDLKSQKYREKLALQLGIDSSRLEHFYKNQRSPALGSALSHTKIYDLMIEHNIPSACVLEDDGYLLPTFPDVLNESQKTTWDVLLLSHQTRSVRDIIELYLDWHASEPKIFFIPFRQCPLFKLIKNCWKYGLYTTYLTLTQVIKYFSNVDPNISSGDFEKKLLEVWACEIGAIPVQNKQLWHKATSEHYIAEFRRKREKNPGKWPTSAMGYMLTREAAIKWKHAVISRGAPIDISLTREKVSLRILTPPCVVLVPDYLTRYSTIRR